MLGRFLHISSRISTRRHGCYRCMNSRTSHGGRREQFPSLRLDYAVTSLRFLTTSSSSATAHVVGNRQGLYGISELMEPQDFLSSARNATRTCDRLSSTFEQTPSPSTRNEAVKILYALDEISRIVCNVIDAAELCRSTHVQESWRNAAHEAFSLLSDYIAQLNANPKLYFALQSITRQTTLFQQLTAEEQRFASLLQAEFERDGIHLPEATREQVRQMQNNIVELEGAFQRNIVQWHREFGASRSDVEAVIPRHVLLEGFGIGAPSSSSPDPKPDSIQLNSNAQVLQTLLKYSPSPSLRQQIYMEYNTACPENLGVLRDLRRERHSLAQTLGFESFAARVLSDNKMVQTPQAVHKFLKSLAEQNTPVYKQEMGFLAQAKMQLEGSDIVEPWDVNYYTTLLKAQLGYDPNEISRYLSLDRCIESIQVLCRDLFGIQMSETSIAVEDRWDGTSGGDVDDERQKVRCFQFTEEAVDRPLGTMYLDLHPRSGKYGHAAHFTVRCGCVVNGMDSTSAKAVHQLPIVALVCNLSSGTESGDTLSHGEVETLFHEMGHALHSLLSRTSFQHVSGTRAAVDFVETPSHLFENYVWDPSFLKLLAVDPNTGESVPELLVQKLIQSRQQLRAIDRQSQILYAAYDQQLFGPPQPPDDEDFFSRESSTNIFAQLHRQMAVPFATGTHWHSRFGHLMTYGAAYYSYLYASEFSTQIWNKKLKGQPLNKQSGRELWQKVLVHGGARDPLLMLQDLLG